MSDRLWDREDEWVGHASCGNDPRFSTAPYWDAGEDKVHLSPEDVAVVQVTCGGCAVRPECIEAACIKRKENSVWVAGVWMPDTFSAPSRRELEKKRTELIDALPHEREVRPANLL